MSSTLAVTILYFTSCLAYQELRVPSNIYLNSTGFEWRKTNNTVFIPEEGRMLFSFTATSEVSCYDIRKALFVVSRNTTRIVYLSHDVRERLFDFGITVFPAAMVKVHTQMDNGASLWNVAKGNIVFKEET